MKKLLWGIFLSLLFISGCAGEIYEEELPRPELVLFETFESKMISGDYTGLYGLLSPDVQSMITEDDFVARYTNIVGGLFTNLSWEICDSFFVEIEDADETYEIDEEIEVTMIPFTATMDTVAGQISRSDFEFHFVIDEEGEAWVDWTDALIYPTLGRDDMIQVWDFRHDPQLRGRRGSILDLNGNILAEDGEVRNIGLWPENLNVEDIERLAEILDVDAESIWYEVENADDPSHRIPFVNLLIDSPIRDTLRDSEIGGLMGAYAPARIYKEHEAFGYLLGHVSSVLADDLEQDAEGIYFEGGVIGRSGLEREHEETLRAIHGISIVIVHDNVYVETIIRREPIDGTDIVISIDTQLQIDIYEAMDGKEGSAAAVDPQTGAVLALVSSPSFNSNHQSGTTHIPYSQLQDYIDRSFENRLATVYSPGSTFKLHTAAIGLELGLINPEEVLLIEGSSAEIRDGITVIRWTDEYTEIDFRRAVAVSDNIYFAEKGLAIGGQDFVSGMENFTIGSPLGIGLSLQESQLSNSGNLDNMNLLAETSFGQGEILATSLHIALDYTMLSNNGNIMNPFLVVPSDAQPDIMRENVVTDENLTILQNAFRSVIEDEDGTGQLASIDGISLAGKTGTGQIRQDADGVWESARWFVATDLDHGQISLAIMIEDLDDSMSTDEVVEMVHQVIYGFLR